MSPDELQQFFEDGALESSEHFSVETLPGGRQRVTFTKLVSDAIARYGAPVTVVPTFASDDFEAYALGVVASLTRGITGSLVAWGVGRIGEAGANYAAHSFNLLSDGPIVSVSAGADAIGDTSFGTGRLV